MAEIKVRLPDGREGTIPEENLAEAQKRGAQVIEPKKSLPERAVESGKGMLDSVLESAEDTGRGVLEGATLGGSAELMGGVTALGALATGQAKSSDELANLYRKYQAIEEEKNRLSQHRSPYLYGAGELGGAVGSAALTGGVALEGALAGKLGSLGVKEAYKQAGKKLLSGGMAKEIAKQGAASAAAAVPYGAVQGALSSDGALINATPQEQEQLQSDAVSGGLSGGLLGGTLGLGLAGAKAGVEAGKEVLGGLKEKIATNKSNPFIRQINKAYEMGEQGINPQNQETFVGTLDKPETIENALSTKQSEEATLLVNKYLEGDKALATKVGEAVDSFIDENGVPRMLDVSDTIKQKAAEFLAYADKNPQIGMHDAAKKVFGVLKTLNDVKPTARAVMDSRENLYKLAKAYEATDAFMAGEARDIAKKLGDQLKIQVPGYKDSAEKLAKYRSMFGETVLAGDTPLEFFDKQISRTKDADAKLQGKFRNMIENVSASGEAGRVGQESFTNFLKNLKELETSNPEIFSKLGITSEGMEGFIRNASDESNTIDLMRGYKPHSSEAGTLKGLFTGGMSAGKGMILNRTRNVGAINRKISDVSKRITQATDSQLMTLSSKLPEALRKSLISAIENKDLAGKNAVVFSLMQNPEYRKIVEQSDIVGESEEVK